MKRLLFLLLVLAAPVFAADTKISALPNGSPAVATDIVPIARAGSNYYIPFSALWALPTGSQFLGPTVTDCTTPAFAFAGDTNAGMCLTLANSAVFQSGVYTGANTGHVTVSDTNSTLSFRNAANELTEWQIGSNTVTGTVKDATRVTLTDTAATFTVPVVLGSTDTLGWSTDLFLRRDAANTLALRNSTNAQTFNIYNTFTDASNYERLAVGVVSNSYVFKGENAGTGLARNMIIQAPGFLQFGSNNTTYVFYWDLGNLIPATTDARNLGTAANAWATGIFTRSIQGSKSKALTDATATAFVRVAIPQPIATNYKGGVILYEIYCDNDTNQASQSGTVKFTCHNRAGTEACNFGTPEGVTLPDGTANLSAPTFDATSGAADTIDLRVTSDCTGITPNTHTIEWRLDMPTTATITPQ